MCVCLSVISEISGTGRRSTTLLTPSWRALPGELCRLLLVWTGCLVREEKPLEPFHSSCVPGELRRLLLVWTGRLVREEKPLELLHSSRVKPRSSHYNGAILKKLVIFLKRVWLFCLQLGCSKKQERSRCVGSFADSGTGLWLANRCPPHKGHRCPSQYVLLA